MDFEKQMHRYFELQKILESDDSSLPKREKLELEFKELSNSFYSIFMQARMRSDLPHSVGFSDWIQREYDQLQEIDSLLIDTDEAIKNIKSNSTLLGSEYSKIWMQNICDTLNKTTVKIPVEKGGGEWTPQKFENVVEFFQYITLDRGIYNYLNERRLINTGYCPVTGQSINDEYFWLLYGRKVHLSEKGKTIAKEYDRNEHVKLFGKEPPTEEEKANMREDVKQRLKMRLHFRLMLIVVVAAVIYKACF